MTKIKLSLGSGFSYVIIWEKILNNIYNKSRNVLGRKDVLSNEQRVWQIKTCNLETYIYANGKIYLQLKIFFLTSEVIPMLFPEFTCNYQKKKIPAPKGEFHLCNVSCSAFLSYYLYRHWACTRLSFVTENIKHVPISRGIKSITGTRRMWKQKIITTYLYEPCTCWMFIDVLCTCIYVLRSFRTQ